MRRTRTHTARWVLVLAGAMLALTIMAGPDLVRHLDGSSRDFHSCPIYSWTHGTRAGTPSAVVHLIPPDQIEAAPLEAPALATNTSVHSTCSRAPPPLA